MAKPSRFIAGFLCLSFALAAMPVDDAEAARKKRKRPAAAKVVRAPIPQASVVINGETGEILECDKCQEERAPASLVKLVTAMVGFDALKSGKISLTDRVPLASAATAQSRGAVTLAAKGVRPGTMVSMDNVFSAIAVTSAADATLTLSKAVCGTESCIIGLMNNKVDEILKDPNAKTNFSNPHGMPGKGQITTAYEMALIMRYMMKNYPQQWHYFGKTSYTVNGITLRGHNASLVNYTCNNALGLPYACMEAGKTGFFRHPGAGQGPAAGFCIAGSAAWNGYRVVAVRMGDQTAASRNQKLENLFDSGFQKLQAQRAPQTVRMPLHFPNLFTPAVDPEEEGTHIRLQPGLRPNP